MGKRVDIANEVKSLLVAGVSGLEAVYTLPLEYEARPQYPCATVICSDSRMHANVGGQRHAQYEVVVSVYERPVDRAGDAIPNLETLLDDVESALTAEGSLSNTVFQIIGDKMGQLVTTEMGMSITGSERTSSLIWTGIVSFEVSIEF